MIKFKTISILICTTSFLISSCGNSSSEASSNTSSSQSSNAGQPKTPAITQDFVGTYHGIQPGYFLKNKNGADMVINGNKVPVPSIDYTFILNSNSTVTMQQISLDDNRRVNYEGSTRIITDNSSTLEIECLLSDGRTSKPTYTLSINKANKKAICAGSNEPVFEIEKTN
jgi:hypothetical protein